jgi:1-acyl-sn-glycerol-3-phosphate acyltransferase
MKRTIEEVFTYLELAACAAAWLPILATSAARHRHDAVPRHEGRWLRRFGRATSALTPLWDFVVEGDPPADIHARPYVVVANHVSTADPFLLSWLPWDMRWVAKEEAFRMPVLGTLIRLGGDVPLRRGDGESVRAMFSACRHTLRNGLSVMIFPEGTRSADGALGPFKEGAFRLAIGEWAPVLPIAIEGTHLCMPKGSHRVGRARAVARILPPIETAGLSPSDAPRVAERARTNIAAALGALGALGGPIEAAPPSAPRAIGSSTRAAQSVREPRMSFAR